MNSVKGSLQGAYNGWGNKLHGGLLESDMFSAFCLTPLILIGTLHLRSMLFLSDYRGE